MSQFAFFSRRHRPASATPEPTPLDAPRVPVSEPSVPMAQEISWERLIPSRSDAAKQVIDEILSQLAALSWSQRDLFGIRLALEEAVVNAIRHGNRFDESKRVAVTCRITSETLHVEIADEGPGFVPEDVPDPTDEENLEKPSGRGIVLMRNFMSQVAYNDQGNCVIMEKTRTTE